VHAADARTQKATSNAADCATTQETRSAPKACANHSAACTAGCTAKTTLTQTSQAANHTGTAKAPQSVSAKAFGNPLLAAHYRATKRAQPCATLHHSVARSLIL
jgi:hypothetical protein